MYVSDGGIRKPVSTSQSTASTDSSGARATSPTTGISDLTAQQIKELMDEFNIT
jgi:hypothetical protein